MTQAWNTLSGQQLTALPATHRYVKWEPQTPAELAELQELKIAFFDFPLDRMRLFIGDFYDHPGYGPEDIQPLYSVVPADLPIPTQFTHTVEEELVLPPHRSLLAIEAFRIAGLNWENNDFMYGEDGGFGGPVECSENCPNYPCCFLEDIGCDDETCRLPLGCNPDSPTWPACLGIDWTEQDPPPSNPVYNDCGCIVSPNRRIPGGCVQVFDTQIDGAGNAGGGWHGLRQVRVRAVNGLFDIHLTETDDDGCFSFDKMFKGKAWFAVKFTNRRVRVRGYRGLRLWEYSQVIEDRTNAIAGPDFNNLSIRYDTTSGNSGRSRMYYYAAIANNAMHDYHDYATSDGVGVPDNGIDVMVTNLNGSAAAPMLNDLQKTVPGLFNITVTLSLVDFFVPGFPLTYPRIYFQAFLPDVVYAYGDDFSTIDGSPRRTDRIYDTFFEEYGHAAHYAAINAPSYWWNNIEHVAFNNIPGSACGTPAGTPGANRCATVEMWGHHIGPFFADRRYGLNHSLSPAGTVNPNVLLDDSHGWGVLEQFNPGSGLPNAWVPDGVFFDLLDDNTSIEYPLPPGSDPVGDTVSGFTHAQCFDALISGVPASPTAVRLNLISNPLPAGATTGSLNTLFAAYGW